MGGLVMVVFPVCHSGSRRAVSESVTPLSKVLNIPGTLPYLRPHTTSAAPSAYRAEGSAPPPRPGGNREPGQGQ